MTKNILVVSLCNFQKALANLCGMGVCVITISNYISGFIGDYELETDWISEKVVEWTHTVEFLSGLELQHLKTAYAGLHKSLQEEWDFVESITHTLKGRSDRWKRPWKTPSSQSFSGGAHPKS